MNIRTANVRELAHEYLGGLAHVHTKLSNFRGHVESDQTITTLMRGLAREGLVGHAGAPFGFVVACEHVSNPVRPVRLRRGSRRERSLERRQWETSVAGVPVLHGFEASLLAEGGIDLPDGLAQEAKLVIASRHQLPEGMVDNPSVMMRLLERACEDPAVDVLGHPARGIEALGGVDWRRVFGRAAATGTAVEINFNTYPDPRREPARERFWAQWLAQLQASGATVLVGFDLHNGWQLARLARDFRSLGRSGEPNIVGAALVAMAEAGIAPERVVNARLDRFRAWTAQAKAARVARPGLVAR
jgi:histidinol phosphatase-like PHP family hydrolase